MTSAIEANQKGFDLRDRVVEAVRLARANSERTQQSKERVLGMSDLGGCREFIRASIAGEPKDAVDGIKWAAEVGTAVGDYVERILGETGEFDVQETVVLTLPKTGIKVTGHLDEIDALNDLVADNKTVDGLADVTREGPSFKNKVQCAGYLVAGVQAGRLTEQGTAHLLYFDRSGKSSEPYVWSTNYEGALLILDAVEDRLLDVQHALATGGREGRDGRLMTDEPESWCWAIKCPFYSKCWDGYTPTGKVEHPRQLEAVRRFVQARADEKDAKERRELARKDLVGVEGITPDSTIIRWTLSQAREGQMSERLDVREQKL